MASVRRVFRKLPVLIAIIALYQEGNHPDEDREQKVADDRRGLHRVDGVHGVDGVGGFFGLLAY